MASEPITSIMSLYLRVLHQEANVSITELKRRYPQFSLHSLRQHATKPIDRRHAGVDGVFSSWSKWSTCKKCGAHNNTKFRNRSCASQIPCRGDSYEVAPCPTSRCKTIKTSEIIYGAVGGVLLLLIVLCVYLIWKKLHKKPGQDSDSPYEITSIQTSEDIHGVLSPKNYELQLIEQIYEAISNFKNCLCSRCISDWLVDLVSHTNHTRQSVQMEDFVASMMRKLKNNQDADIMAPGKLHDDCLSEHVVREWVADNVMYDRLDETSQNRQHPRLLFGAFDLEGTVYDTFDFSPKSLATRQHAAVT